MIKATGLRRCVGDLAVYRAFQDTFEVLIDEQLRKLTGAPGEWVVIPLNKRNPQGFYLLSADLEGQRRGREVLDAFLGPTTAALTSMRLSKLQQVDRDLETAGVAHLSYVKRVADHQKMVDRIRIAVSTIASKDARPRPTLVPHLYRLRDFRFALAQQNSTEANNALHDLQLSGQLSLENLRFLEVELHGRLGRWAELRRLHYFNELLITRRPRAINELLLEMIWQIDIANIGVDRPLSEIADEADLTSLFGAVIGSLDVPGTEPGRKVAAIAAANAGDEQRLTRILDAAGPSERDDLQRLLDRRETPAPTSPPAVGLYELHSQGQFTAVVQRYIEHPEPGTTMLAVDALLRMEDREYAPAVLAAVEGFHASNLLPQLTRGNRRDIEDLRALVDSTCSDWASWLHRVGAGPWPDAERILRASHEDWPDLETLTADEADQAAEDLLHASIVANADQVIASLDLLCLAAARTTSRPHLAQFSECVLEILKNQENISGPVRHAYLGLLDSILATGPTADRYESAIEGASTLWTLIAAPIAVDWGIDLVDLLVANPSPSPGTMISVISAVLGRIRDMPVDRLSLRQRTAVNHQAEHAGLPVVSATAPTTEPDTAWSTLANSEIGIYTLRPDAVDQFRDRLQRMQVPKSVTVTGNSDKVSTPILRALAGRADYMIVDTWHAAHAATNAIDEILPRDRQLLPEGRGVSAYIRVLESALSQHV